MTCTGKKGTWTITYTFGGVTQSPIDYPASNEDDSPFFSNESGQAILRSACDGRNMEPPYFSSNFSSVSITSKVFTADDNSSQPHDCINGACTPKTTYNTPGLYPSLSDCQEACGTGCSGKCISNSDWATIEGLASQLKNHEC